MPLRERRSASSSPRKRFESWRVRDWGIWLRTAMREKIKSMLMPAYSNLMIGTKESTTGVRSVIAPGGDIFTRRSGKYLKKSSRVTCLGPTTRVSISEPGPNTPNRKLPYVKILPPAEFATLSGRPCALLTCLMNSSVMACNALRASVLHQAH